MSPTTVGCAPSACPLFMSGFGVLVWLRGAHLWCCLLLVCLLASAGWAQVPAGGATVSGHVLDDDGISPLPAVRVVVEGTQRGVVTGMDGSFRIKLPPGKYLLVVDFVGYQAQKIPVTITTLPIALPNIVLKSREYEIGEVVISSKALNPAHRVIRNVIRNKQLNKLDRFEAYEIQKYSRLALSLDNLAAEELNRGILRAAKDMILREGLDSTHTNDSAGNRYTVPLFMSEAVSNVYYKRPGKIREEVVASRQRATVDIDLPLLNSLVSTVDIYNNYIRTPGKDFVSPIADGAFGNYDYFIIKSEQNGKGDTTYTIELFPLTKYEPAFRGILVISSRDWAIKQADLTMNQRPGINFVEGMRYRIEYQQVDGQWVPRMVQVDIDFENLLGNGKGVHGRSVLYYSDYKLNQPRPDAFFRNTSIEVLSGASTQGDDFWRTHTMVPMSASEDMALRAMDTLRRAPIWRAYNLAVELGTGGYKQLGNFLLGPTSRMLGFNPIEGLRLQLGVYTNARFSKRWNFGGSLGYGFKDERVKYSAEASYALHLRPRIEIGFARVQDLEQTGFDNFQIEGTGFINSLLARVPLRQLSYFSTNKAFMRWDIANGVALGGSLTTKYYEPAFDLFFDGGEGRPIRASYRTTELAASARLSIRERYVLRDGRKIYQGTPIPVLYAEFWKGIDGALGGEFDYKHLRLTLTNKYRTGRFGNINFTLQAGKIWGTVPYASLYVFKGSNTYGMNPTARGGDFANSMFTRYNYSANYLQPGFNLLSFFEFAADKYAVLSVDHYLDGWLFRKIPLIRRLQWKEILRLRVGYGTLRDDNLQFNRAGLQPEVLVQAPSAQPYVEAGFGIENIFRVLEVNFLWRLTYRDPIPPSGLNDPFGFNFGIRLNARVQF